MVSVNGLQDVAVSAPGHWDLGQLNILLHGPKFGAFTMIVGRRILESPRVSLFDAPKHRSCGINSTCRLVPAIIDRSRPRQREMATLRMCRSFLEEDPWDLLQRQQGTFFGLWKPPRISSGPWGCWYTTRYYELKMALDFQNSFI